MAVFLHVPGMEFPAVADPLNMAKSRFDQAGGLTE